MSKQLTLQNRKNRRKKILRVYTQAPMKNSVIILIFYATLKL